MTDRPRASFGPGLLAAAGFVVVLVAMAAARDLVIEMVLAAIAATLTAPVATRARQAGWPGWAALTAAIAAFIAVIVGVGVLLLVPYLNILAGADDLIVMFQTFLENVATWLGSIGLDSIGEAILDTVHPAVVLAPILGLGASFLSLTVTFGIVGIILMYLLADIGSMADRVRGLRGADTELPTRASDLSSAVREYVVIRTVLGGVAAILDTLLLLVLGVPFALAWGVLSFILSFIPNLGFLLSLVPPTILAFVMPGGGVGPALIVVIGYSVINVTIDFFIQPRYAGLRLNVSPLAMIVSLFFWGFVLGPAGALLAVPLTLGVKAVFDAFPDTRWISTVLSEGSPTPSEPPA